MSDSDIVVGKYDTDGLLYTSFGTDDVTMYGAAAGSDLRDKGFSLSFGNQRNTLVGGISTLSGSIHPYLGGKGENGTIISALYLV